MSCGTLDSNEDEGKKDIIERENNSFENSYTAVIGEAFTDSLVYITDDFGSTSLHSKAYYRFHLDSSGLIRIESDGIPSGFNAGSSKPLDRVYLCNAEKEEISYFEMESPNCGGYYNLEAGDYFLVFGYYNISYTSSPFAFTVSYDSVDIYESNDNRDNATGIILGEKYQCKIFPEDDVDFYSISVDEPKLISFDIDSISSKYSLQLDVYDDEGTLLTIPNNSIYTEDDTLNNTIVLDKMGTYYFELSAHFNYGNADKPFSFTVNEYNTDINEYNNSISTATTLELSSEISGSVFPQGDLDYYKVEISEETEVMISLTNVSSKVAAEITLKDDENSVVYLWNNTTSGIDVIKKYKLPAGVHYFVIEGWTRSQCSEKLYNFSVKPAAAE